jgi:hypothetical protein
MRRQNRIPFDRNPTAMILGAVAIVSVLAVIVVVGPSEVFDFLFGFLLPMAVGLLVVVGVIVLVAREGGRVLDSRNRLFMRVIVPVWTRPDLRFLTRNEQVSGSNPLVRSLNRRR